MKNKTNTKRIEALEAELSKITNAAAEVIESLKAKIADKDKKIKDLLKLKKGVTYKNCNSAKNPMSNDLKKAVKFLKKDKTTNLYRLKRQLEVTEEYAESLIHSLYETGRIKKETIKGGDGWNTSYDIEEIRFIS